MRKLFMFAVLLLCMVRISFSQIKPYINEIIDQVRSNARLYFLSANRPSYGVSSYMVSASSLEGTAGVYFNKDVYDIPIDLNYGISDKIEISGGISFYQQTYNYLGERVRGIGDSYVGLKYKFHESQYFNHVIQGILKIPTASKTKQLGTGKFDFHFGAAQGFMINRFSYELSFGFSLLARRNFPTIDRMLPPELRAQLDTLKQLYNYRYEPEITFSVLPAYDVTNYAVLYTGYSFTRNTKLNFNTSSVLGGIGFSVGKRMSLSLGGTFGLDKESGWLAGMGASFLISGN